MSVNEKTDNSNQAELESFGENEELCESTMALHKKYLTEDPISESKNLI